MQFTGTCRYSVKLYHSNMTHIFPTLAMVTWRSGLVVESRTRAPILYTYAFYALVTFDGKVWVAVGVSESKHKDVLLISYPRFVVGRDVASVEWETQPSKHSDPVRRAQWPVGKCGKRMICCHPLNAEGLRLAICCWCVLIFYIFLPSHHHHQADDDVYRVTSKRHVLVVDVRFDIAHVPYVGSVRANT